MLLIHKICQNIIRKYIETLLKITKYFMVQVNNFHTVDSF